jgi:peptide deformylase
VGEIRGKAAAMSTMDLTTRLRELGIRQEGDAVLRQECEPFDLPRERAEAIALWDDLRAYVERLQEIYPFTKGIGLAAPQIGILRAMSVVKSQEQEPFSLLNPVVVWRSDEEDEKYEGCLSFFDVRVPVSRPLAVRVELETLSGARSERHFERGLARLVLHEIDHLHGTLARDLIPAGSKPIPLSEYRDSYREWTY